MLYNHTLGRAAKYFPDSLAVVDGERRVSFAGLASRVERLAGGLAGMGFVPGDRLAFLLPNCLEFVELTFACCRLGVIMVAMNTRHAPAELDEVLEDAGPRGLVLDATLPRPTRRAPWTIVRGEQDLPESAAAPPAPFYDPAAVFGLFYTGGTTGRAKGVMLTHQNLLANLQNSQPNFDLKPGSVFLHAAPMFHLADFPVVLSAAAAGAASVTVPRFDVRAVCEVVQKERVTGTVLIPTMINLLTQFDGLASYDLSSLHHILYGGAPMAPEIVRRTRETLPGCRLTQGYGLSEASPLITVLADEEHTPERALSCGRPVQGVEVAIVDEHGAPVERGQSGEIVARGANIMKGYWDKPAETRDSMFGDWLRTGDIAWEDEQGFCYIVDRRKDMIVTGGENVYSTEVEAAVYSHPAVSEAAVIGVPDAQWGEAVMACVVVKPGLTLEAEELRGHCRTKIANYKVPRRVEFYSTELPKSGAGKILKRELRARYWDSAARAVN